jgi:hypothetical protein
MQGINIMIEDRTEKVEVIRAALLHIHLHTPSSELRKAESQPVDLNFSGRMLSHLCSSRRVAKGVQEIYFDRAEESRKAYFNNQ